MDPKDANKSKHQRRRERKERQQKRIEATRRELQSRAAVSLEAPALDTLTGGVDVQPASPAALFLKVAERLPKKTPPGLFAKTVKKVLDGTIDFGNRSG